MSRTKCLLIAVCAVVLPYPAAALRAETPFTATTVVEVEWKASTPAAPAVAAPPKHFVVPTSMQGDPVASPSPATPAAPVASATTAAPYLISAPAYNSYRIWGSAEYLGWWFKGMNVPPLVTTGNATGFGVLGDPATRIVNGNDKVNTNMASGMRLRFGAWLDECQTCGLDGGLFAFGQLNNRYSATSTGDPSLFRPFNDTNPNSPGPNSELVALRLPNSTGGFDPILTGTVLVQNSTDFAGWDANFRHRLCADPCGNWYVDGLLGYRYLRLRDVTTIQESLLSTDPLEFAAPLNTRINVIDRFETINTFNGAQVGLVAERRWGRWIANMRGTVALGVTHERINISGSTQVIAPDGATAVSTGGLLAQTSNIGSYSANFFSVVPEINLNLGYQVTDHIRVFGGYSFLYWSNVARSAEQINLNVNSSLIPANGPVVGPNNPTFQRHSTDFWAQGFNVGVQLSW